MSSDILSMYERLYGRARDKMTAMVESSQQSPLVACMDRWKKLFISDMLAVQPGGSQHGQALGEAISTVELLLRRRDEAERLLREAIESMDECGPYTEVYNKILKHLEKE